MDRRGEGREEYRVRNGMEGKGREGKANDEGRKTNNGKGKVHGNAKEWI